MLKISQAATALGLTEACIRKWIFLGRIEYHKLGSAVRIPESEIGRIKAESRVPAVNSQRRKAS
jgi:excisionase family DNA binding protein